MPVPQSLYPPAFQGKSRLHYYAFLFNTVEINSSFYKLPRLSTVAKWAASVPDKFQFTFKLSKTVTHAKALDFTSGDIDLFMQTINNIGNKKGCILVQLPPALKAGNISNLERLIQTIKTKDKDNDWKIAVEFRNMSWYNSEVNALLLKHKASLVFHDLAASATSHRIPTSDVIYLRFHGTEKGYRGSYTNDELLRYALKIKLWIEEGKTVYCYFNNTLGKAVENLETLNKLVLA